MAGSQRLKRMADSVQRELSDLIRPGVKRSASGWSSDHLSRESQCGYGIR